MIVKNVKLNWTYVKTVNEMSGKYTTDFYFQDEEAETNFINVIDKAWEEHKGT